MHEANNSFLGGVHIELTGEDVTECTGGARGLTDADLARVQVDGRPAPELRTGARDGDAHRTPRPGTVIATLSVMQYERITVPKDGQRITINPDASLNVPDNPIIAFIEGDGIGIDITPVMLKVVTPRSRGPMAQSAIAWCECSPATRPRNFYGTGFPDETLTALRGSSCPSGPARRRSAAACVRSTWRCAEPRSLRLRAAHRYFPGVSTPMADASLTDMVVFRENTEDIYAGIEWPTGSNEVHKLIHFLQTELKVRASASPRAPASASSPCRKRAASASCARPSSTPSKTIACR